jgi:hypothetical protein
LQGLASEGNVRYDWSSFHEYQQKTMFFEDQAPIRKNLYLSGIPEMTSMIHTCVRHLASERRLWKAENRLLRHKLENVQRALQDTREDAAMASWQLKVENVALKSEISHLRMALVHARQFIPQLYVDLPSPPLVPKSPSSLSSNTIASSSTASIQSTISTIGDVASVRLDTSLPAGSTRCTVVHKKDSSATTLNVDASKHQATTKAKRTCCACSICVKLLCFLVFCVILTVLLAYFVSYFFGNRLSVFS